MGSIRQQISSPFSRKGTSGFSVLELMITLVIVGILVGIAGPIYYNNIEKARRAEGEATLGSIRNEVLVYYATHGTYPTEDLDLVMSQDWHNIKPGELASVNFGDSSYYYQGGGSVYLIGLHRGDVLELHRSLNQDGEYQDWDVNVNE